MWVWWLATLLRECKSSSWTRLTYWCKASNTAVPRQNRLHSQYLRQNLLSESKSCRAAQRQRGKSNFRSKWTWSFNFQTSKTVVWVGWVKIAHPNPKTNRLQWYLWIWKNTLRLRCKRGKLWITSKRRCFRGRWNQKPCRETRSMVQPKIPQSTCISS